MIYIMYTLENKLAIDFYNRHPHIDFNAINGVFVSILENLMTNLSDKIDNSQNTFLLKQLSEKYKKIIEKEDGEIVKTENWGLLNFANKIQNFKKGFYIHLKFKGKSSTINEIKKE